MNKPRDIDITKDDLVRIERKLDQIIKHFSIGNVPRRSLQEIDHIVEQKILNLQRRQRQRKKEV